MAETRDPSTEPGDPSPYLRLPTAAVAVGLLVVLAAALGFGIFANQNLRQRSTAAAVNTAVPKAVETSAASADTPVPTATAPAPIRTVLPTPAVIAAVETPVADPTATPASILDPALVEEVSTAYERYWQVRAEALYELDSSHLAEVMDNGHLASVASLIDELRAEGRAIQTSVEHSYRVEQATRESAQIVDLYVSNSLYVDPDTHAPLSEPTADTLRERYNLQNIGGSWKVVNLVSLQ